MAWEVAHALQAPLDLLLVRTIGTPGFVELALGAAAEGQPPQLLLNEPIIEEIQPPRGWIETRLAVELDGKAGPRRRSRVAP